MSTQGRLSPAESVRVKRDATLQLQLDVQRGAPLPLTPEENLLAKQPRGALVDALMRDPLYTDARLLSHLPKRKLARMLSQSRQRVAADAAAERLLA